MSALIKILMLIVPHRALKINGKVIKVFSMYYKKTKVVSGMEGTMIGS